MQFFPAFHILATLTFQFSGLQSEVTQFTKVNKFSSKLPILREVALIQSPSILSELVTGSSQLGLKKGKESPEDQKLKELEKLSDAEKKQESLEKKLGEVADYNKDLMNTVFTSLLGTVVTVTLGVLAINVVGNLVQREREKAEIIKEVQDSIQEQVLEWMDALVRHLQIRVRWLEYEVASLSAEQLEPQDELEYSLALQERLRAIQAAQKLISDSQSFSVQECIIYQLEEIESLLEKADGTSNSIAHSEEQSLIFVQFKRENTEKVLSNLSSNLDDLCRVTSNKRIKEKIQNIKLLVRKRVTGASSTQPSK